MTSAVQDHLRTRPGRCASCGWDLRTQGHAPACNPVAQEYLDTITAAINRHPRSLQQAIGPSEIGHPCARRLGYKFLTYPEKPQAPNWKATVGTACHAWLENVFDQWNQDNAVNGQERYLVETKVSVGEIDGKEIKGSCDLYDRATYTVTDWKTVGPTQLKKYRSSGPGDQYRIQAHLYGRGWVRAGYQVERVQIVFLPRNGELRDAFTWSEPWSEETALNGLERATGIALATRLMKAEALASLATANAYCHLCPFFLADSTDPAAGCPGDPTSPAAHVPEPDEFPFGRI